MVYDISNRLSFNEIQDYYCNKIKELCQKDIPIILLGNKTDLEDERQVSKEEGIALALSYNYKFKETSALKNENVADAFEALIELWNVDYQEKKSSKRRRSNGNLSTKKKTLTRSNTTTKVRKKTLDSESEDESNTIKLKNNKTEKHKKRNCCS